MTTMTVPLLEVKDLITHFFVEGKTLHAVDGVSFSLKKGEILGLVGESGCGKSVTALSILRLVPSPGRVVSGEVIFEGKNILEMDEDELRDVRGNRISMVFQEPMSALNPVFTVGDQVSEVLRLHRGMDRVEALDSTTRLFERVGISDPARRLSDYPHQMSGGMQQRVLIAMAMACEPQVLIADEPTTALDVTVQAQILKLIEELIREGNRGALLITHDLGVVAQFVDRICVMYAGVVVEMATVNEIFDDPQHPYTVGLINSLPAPGKKRFEAIGGSVPDLTDLPGGCRFHPRCLRAQARCTEKEPDLTGSGTGWAVRCYFPGGKNRDLGRAI